MSTISYKNFDIFKVGLYSPKNKEPTLSGLILRHRMLTQKGLYYYNIVLIFATKWKVLPYDWDVKDHRLVRSKTWKCFILFHLHTTVLYFSFAFSTSRLLMSFRKGEEEFPLFLKLLNITWMFANAMGSVVMFMLWLVQ